MISSKSNSSYFKHYSSSVEKTLNETKTAMANNLRPHARKALEEAGIIPKGEKTIKDLLNE